MMPNFKRRQIEVFRARIVPWLNAVEGFFSKLTRRRLKRGVFSSVADLQEAINRFIAEHNENPKPFVWTADPHAIIEKVRRGNLALASNH